MRFQIGLAVVAALALGAPLHAQDTTQPGGLNKVAHDISSASKKAGRNTKAEVHRAASRTHVALKNAGNATKTTLRKTTGVTTPAPSPEHKPGGLNKVARDVSHASKKAGSSAKHGIKNSSSAAHDSLKKAGNSAKAATRDTSRTRK